eukprot:symbB.v1.2.022082.t1/scaffold1938.1/size102858/4
MTGRIRESASRKPSSQLHCQKERLHLTESSELHHRKFLLQQSSTFEPLMRFDSLCSANDCEIFWTKKGCESKCFLLPFLAMDAKCYFNSLSSATHSSCTLALWHTGPYCHIAPSRHMPQVKWCRILELTHYTQPLPQPVKTTRLLLVITAMWSATSSRTRVGNMPLELMRCGAFVPISPTVLGVSGTAAWRVHMSTTCKHLRPDWQCGRWFCTKRWCVTSKMLH